MTLATPVRATDRRVETPAEQLLHQGFCRLPAAIPAKTVAALLADLAPRFDATPFCAGDFYGARTKRFGRLLAHSQEMADLVLHQQVLDLAHVVLGPWCDMLQLNLAQAIAIHPGALAQFPHRDQDMWRGDIGVREYLINVIWPLDRFTADNGATVIWPRSHGAAATFEPLEAPFVAIADPGDAIVFLGSTLHGGGANISAVPRRGIIVSYCLGWLKPYENQWLAYPPSVAKHFPSDLAALVGYRQHRPNLGNYEGQCPSVLLEDKLPEHIAAIDALRPDQAAMLADHVKMQRGAP